MHEKVLDHLIFSEETEKIFHLGDDYKDAELEKERGIDIIHVPGIYCTEYSDKLVDNKACDTFQGVNIIMAHDIKDITEKDILVNDIILFGHSHKSELRILNSKLYLNPGHLKSEKDKNRVPSYGLLDIDYGEIKASISEINGKVVSSMLLKKGETGLYKV
jgi:predicted phosphodiesterase